MGSLVFQDQPGKIQIVAATVNNLVSPQTFALTTGSSGCYEESRSDVSLRYIENNNNTTTFPQLHSIAVLHSSSSFHHLATSQPTLASKTEQLPTEQKLAIQQFYIQQKCYKEIADVTAIDVNKIRSFIQNGRRNLKICMDKMKLSQKKR